MSLVSLSSRNENVQGLVQNPNNFRNNFPQPLVLKPHSQVCLTNLTFTAVEGDLFEIQGNDDINSFTGNNKLLFGFDDAQETAGYDVAILTAGKYKATTLATEIARAMNEANRMKYYTISCVFSEGNPNANPVELDEFTISYTETAGLNPTVYARGDWTPSTRHTSTNVVFSDTSSSVAGTAVLQKRVAFSNTATATSHAEAFSWQKGLLLYTQGQGGGSCSWTIPLSDGATALPDSDSSSRIHNMKFGLVRPTLAGTALEGVAGQVDARMRFQSTRSDIEIETLRDGNGNRINIYISRPKYDGRTIFEKSKRILVRSFTIGAITVPALRSIDFLMIRVTPFFRTNDFIVQIFKSIDGGATFTALANGGGTARDGRPVVYTEDMGGFADGNGGNPAQFTSVVYSTRGVDDGAGGRIKAIFEQFLPAVVNLIPWVRMPRQSIYSGGAGGTPVNQQVYTGLDLLDGSEDAPCQFQLDIGGGVTANNQYTISFQNSGTGYGYDGKISIAVNPTTDDAPVPTTDVNGVAFKQDARDVSKWSIYTDDTVPIATAVPIGTMVYDLSTNTGGLTINGGFGGGNWVGTVVGTNKPSPLSTPAFSDITMVENPADSLTYLRRGSDVVGSIYPYEKIFTTAPTTNQVIGVVIAGGILNTAFRAILGQVTQNDIRNIGTGQYRRLTTQLSGTVQRTLGFSQTTVQLARATRQFLTDISPDYVLDGANNLHVSVPELSNVKSVEGESSQQYKTIAIVPKNTFTTDDTGVMSYLSSYENWIDVNNAETLNVNELSFQIRKPNGKVSKYVSGTTRATIKFREDPEVKRERMFEKMADRMALLQTQTSQPLIDRSSFVGS